MEKREIMIDNLIFELLDVPSNLKGYPYLRYAIRLSVLSPRISMMKLYEKIAAVYDVTPTSVERNIRTVLQKSDMPHEKNSFFIKKMAAKIRGMI